mmetsp:Transcript_29047/g.52019  ORF Transcript_29047/g.52019 Transcript_29047/m.52019 type:complete len:333 (-) Transcript_29047:109-1107(-)|eukprot:CAMPEP_0115067232 /NCGR_PEP_ID=MMETSP0227-20121206/11268_1 /TAXON_ID=89957 /ORGANISM="Polarella glacialis, Strain CCMP 1383" /LENGTH=332 /DNA_ID=CAMNT_0002453261 /DNA_START=154 /DNA_END=1152 /DNA_ORIENTATION=-
MTSSTRRRDAHDGYAKPASAAGGRGAVNGRPRWEEIKSPSHGAAAAATPQDEERHHRGQQGNENEVSNSAANSPSGSQEEHKDALIKAANLPKRDRWADIEVEATWTAADEWGEAEGEGPRDGQIAGRRQLGPRGGRRPKFPIVESPKTAPQEAQRWASQEAPKWVPQEAVQPAAQPAAKAVQPFAQPATKAPVFAPVFAASRPSSNWGGNASSGSWTPSTAGGSWTPTTAGGGGNWSVSSTGGGYPSFPQQHQISQAYSAADWAKHTQEAPTRADTALSWRRGADEPAGVVKPSEDWGGQGHWGQASCRNGRRRAGGAECGGGSGSGHHKW